jgi:hypothetical protein
MIWSAARLAVFLPLVLFGARAQVMYLTGALAYQSDSSGNDVGGAWEYDTFSGTPNAKFYFNGVNDFALPLSPGLNSFAVTGASGTATPYFGLGLYFATTATTFTGPFDAAPNLVIQDHANTGTIFAFATNGAQVSTFGQFSTLANYSGATTFIGGGYVATISAFDYDAGTLSGTLLVSVSAVPEPSALILLAVGILTLGTRGFWHRLQRSSKSSAHAG